MDNPFHWINDPFESVVERRIQEAMDRGEFDELPGAGEPLPDAGRPYDELWWVKSWLKRNKLSESPGESSPPAGNDPAGPQGQG